jgi:alkylation response protein AidB-like acyl-CoA dehydrogenase
MHSPGVTVRPLRQIHGASGFNQVFFEDVRVPRSRIVGALNDGWRVATQTLRFERAGMVNSRAERRLGIITRMARETSVDGVPRIKDPVIRERLVRYSAIVEALRLIGIESLSAGLQGHPSGPAASIAKLLWSETDQSMADFGVELLGPFGILQVGSAHAQRRGHPATSYLLMRAATIGGGTSEIQRNIIGEHLLGLPKD